MTERSRFPGSAWLWPAFKFVATLAVWGTIAVIGILGWFALDLPDVDEALQATRRPTVTLIGADGAVFAARGDLYGVPVRLSALPKSLPQAVIATEDRRFYSHLGLDPIGIARAAWANVRAGRIVQGGSTVTQQAAKNLFLTPERSFKRKIQEVLLALWLEQKFTKHQILTIYLNRVYLGAGTYGVDAAARKYFGRSVEELSLYESAMIAGLLKAPSRYNPQASPGAAAGRTRQVLKNMVAAGYLTERQAADAAKQRGRRYRPPITDGRYFADWVLSQLGDYVTLGGRDLSVITTLNPGLQRSAERHVAAAVSGTEKTTRAGQGALVAMAGDGAVRALVGGRSHAESPFNRATQAARQPGSAFKPFVFLTALETGMTPASPVDDSPIEIDGWKPRNFDGKHRGTISLGKALADSVNTAAVRVGRQVGFGNVADTASRLGVPGSIKARPSLALGTHDIRLIDLTAAYAPFANGGFAAWPFGITEIRDADGSVLYKRGGSGPGRVVEVEHVAAMNSMMAGVLSHGTGRKAQLQRPAAGKTGTSQNHRDAWFVGYTADLVAGVWVGNDNGAPMKRVTGGGLPARIWRRFMADAHRGLPVRSLPGVDGMSPPKPTPGATTIAEKPKTKPSTGEPGLIDRILTFFNSPN
ncbi:MAG: PBP1A family penicillin-binding protein [Rhodospirillaceae bacterium]|nr:PBP1A family penicillin-binding protein [Rhodospirillaceae bacterium]